MSLIRHLRPSVGRSGPRVAGAKPNRLPLRRPNRRVFSVSTKAAFRLQIIHHNIILTAPDPRTLYPGGRRKTEEDVAVAKEEGQGKKDFTKRKSQDKCKSQERSRVSRFLTRLVPWNLRSSVDARGGTSARLHICPGLSQLLFVPFRLCDESPSNDTIQDDTIRRRCPEDSVRLRFNVRREWYCIHASCSPVDAARASQSY